MEGPMLDEPVRVVKASRAVSARELAKGARSLIDEIERDGSVFVLSRYGRMVAVLAPIPERTILEFSGPGWNDEDEDCAAPDELADPPDGLVLDEIQRAVLRNAAQAHPMPFGVGGMPFDVSSLAVALTKLERKGLIGRIGAGRKLTRDGLAAARWLDSAEAAPPS
jgi:hypothetical protein